MPSNAAKHAEAVRLVRYDLMGSGATVYDADPDTGLHLRLVAHGGLRVTAAGRWQKILTHWHEREWVRGEPEWSGLAFYSPSVNGRELAVLMPVKNLGRLISVTERALTDAGRGGEL